MELTIPPDFLGGERVDEGLITLTIDTILTTRNYLRSNGLSLTEDREKALLERLCAQAWARKKPTRPEDVWVALRPGRED